MCYVLHVRVTLADIIPPRAVKDWSHHAWLVAAYEAGETVPPVVVLRREGRDALAVTGAHRIAAMRTVFDDAAPLADDDRDVVFVDCDGADLAGVYDRAHAALLVGGCPDVADLARALPADHPAQAAMVGQ